MKPHKIALYILLLLFINTFNTNAQSKKRVDVLNNDKGKSKTVNGKRINIFIGNIHLKQGDVHMKCDSAVRYADKMMIEGFGNVHLYRGDTLHLYSDYFKLFTNTRKSEVRHNVKLIDNETVLTTDSLNFDFYKNYGNYFNGGIIINKGDTLVSNEGEYFSDLKKAYFTNNVVINSKDGNVESDTLTYYTQTGDVEITCLTKIYNKDAELTATKGRFNTQTRNAVLNENSELYHKNQIIKGDKVIYDDVTGIGKAYKNVSLKDTTNNITVFGEYLNYDKIRGNGFVTDSVLMIQVSKNRDTLFMHSDTIYSVIDTAGNRHLNAFNKVKVYKSDLQAKCDSLSYSMKDSIMVMYQKPIVWSQQHQLTAEKVSVFMKNGEVDHFVLDQKGLMVSEEDSIHYNQIKGRQIFAYVKNRDLYKIEVKGNAECIYYPRDNKNAPIFEINKSICSDIIAFLKKRNITRIDFIKKAESTYSPVAILPLEQLKLKEFVWYPEQRPKSKEDIYIWETIPKLEKDSKKEEPKKYWN